jgi:hypothetical protein
MCYRKGLSDGRPSNGGSTVVDLRLDGRLFIVPQKHHLEGVPDVEI